jgi:hypothetical protein
VAVPAEDAAGFEDLLAALTGGAAHARAAGEAWVDR